VKRLSCLLPLRLTLGGFGCQDSKKPEKASSAETDADFDKVKDEAWFTELTGS
jgi:hypothetical protein